MNATPAFPFLLSQFFCHQMNEAAVIPDTMEGLQVFLSVGFFRVQEYLEGLRRIECLLNRCRTEIPFGFFINLTIN